jgi:holin (3TMs family)
MGLIGRVLGLRGAPANIGAAVEGVAEVFVPNATKRMTKSYEAYQSALQQYGQEFAGPHQGWFDRFVNGLNRLPRPALAIGTIGLFVYAMASPEHFATRMQGLAYVPEPLWWLLGAVVSFYFGAREMYYARAKRPGMNGFAAPVRPVAREAGSGAQGNPALEEWRDRTGR